jgi:hypothetical protein
LLAQLRIELQYLVGSDRNEPDRWQRARMRLTGVRDGMLGR